MTQSRAGEDRVAQIKHSSNNHINRFSSNPIFSWCLILNTGLPLMLCQTPANVLRHILFQMIKTISSLLLNTLQGYKHRHSQKYTLGTITSFFPGYFGSIQPGLLSLGVRDGNIGVFRQKCCLEVSKMVILHILTPHLSP